VCGGEQVDGASCTLINHKGAWFVKTPSSVMTQKRCGVLAVNCKKESSASDGKFQSQSNGGVWREILACGIIGYAVDAVSSAGFDYRPSMTVLLSEILPH
jgi:hypothetical protein